MFMHCFRRRLDPAPRQRGFELLYTFPVELGALEVQLLELGQPLQMREPCVGDFGVVEGQVFEFSKF